MPRPSTLALTLVFLSPLARAAEPPPPRAERVASPGRSAVSDDSSEALSLNPANIAFLPGAEARFSFLRCPNDAQKVGCGYSWNLATPLFLGLATGFRVDYVRPPWGNAGEGVGFPFRGYDYTWLTWGLAFRGSDAVSLGFSVQHAYSSNAYVDGMTSLTAALSVRPSPYLALAAVAHDFNGPRSSALSNSGFPVLDRSYMVGATLRPTAKRSIELGVELKVLETTGQALPRLTAGVDIPGFGRARGDLEVAHLESESRRSFIASLGLEVAIDRITVGGGALAGNGLGSSTTMAQYGTVSLAGFRSPGVSLSKRVVSIRLESTPGVRGHVRLLRKLWRLAEDPEVAGVMLVLRSEPASSLARAEEVADALRLLRAYGKKSVCSWEDAGPKALYVCANADRTVVNPAGGLRYAGLKSHYFYLAGLLSKVGIRADFVRRGPHKSAPEQFTNEGGSDVARADHWDLLRNQEAVFVRNVALGRKLSESHVRAMTSKGPFVAAEAREAGFVDGVAYDDELERVAQEVMGTSMRVEKYQDDTRAPLRNGLQPRIAILYVEGDIVDGRSQRVPLLSMHLAGSYSIAEVTRALREDSTVRAVVLRIESPGGSSMASEVMARELSELAKVKPLIVSMGSVAASGGYHIATAGSVIFALPLSVTGSIGVFYGKADVSGLLGKLGVNVETFRTTSRADAETLFRPFSPEERVELDRKVGQFYDQFVERVAQGRHLTKQEVDAVGQGRVWTGQQALQHKLVDRLGGLRHALEAARQAGRVPSDAPIVEVPSAEPTLVERLIGLGGERTSEMAVIPAELQAVVRALAPLAVHRADAPLERLEWGGFEETEEE